MFSFLPCTSGIGGLRTLVGVPLAYTDEATIAATPSQIPTMVSPKGDATFGRLIRPFLP